nr:c-type cytochrome [Verrucomicrobiota bacterium]
AIRSAPPPQMAKVFAELSGDTAFSSDGPGADFLAQLATGIGARREAREVQSVFEFASGAPPRFTMLAALGEGLARARSSLAKADRESRLPALFASARKTLDSVTASAADRAAAARLLGFDATPESRDALLGALSQRAPEPLVRAIFDALGRASDDATAATLLQRWKGFDARSRAEAARFLAANPSRARTLLDAVQRAAVAVEDIPSAQAAQLRQHRNQEIAALAAKLFPLPAFESRGEVVRRFSPALQLAPDAAKGRVVFQQRCASCHRMRGEGYAFGPDLESVVSGGKEKLLTQVLDPNREVAPQFAAYMAELKDGTMLAGVLANESAATIVVREPLGRETTLPRSRITRLQTTGASPMPDGLEAGLTPQDLADLLGFLTAPAPR